MNIGAPWPDLIEAERWVLVVQTKLHQWAMADPGRSFDDLFNLVYDPVFLAVAWARVRGNKGSQTAGIDGVSSRYFTTSVELERLDRFTIRQPCKRCNTITVATICGGTDRRPVLLCI